MAHPKDILPRLATLGGIAAAVSGMAASGPDPAPDIPLAYRLATVAYCAYAIRPEFDADMNKARALACLRGAAANDGRFLSDLMLDGAEVEIGQDRQNIDAYLLVKTKSEVILAFRGTVPPPIEPSDAASPAPIAPAEAPLGFATTVRDWMNNLLVFPKDGAHTGFQLSWANLKATLNERCGGGAAKCSRLGDFLDAGQAPPLPLYLTGHSKGGALATLAAIDPPASVPAGAKVVAYTFDAPKALLLLNGSADDVSDRIWRFEYANDLVPLLPTQLMGYRTAGRRYLFEDGQAPRVAPEDNAFGEISRLGAILNAYGGSTTSALNMKDLSSLADLTFLRDAFAQMGLLTCRTLVDSHFAVFADLRDFLQAEALGAGDAFRSEAGARALSPFATGAWWAGEPPDLRMPGYNAWCPKG